MGGVVHQARLCVGLAPHAQPNNERLYLVPDITTYRHLANFDRSFCPSAPPPQ